MLLLPSLTSIVPRLLCACSHPEGEDKSLHQSHLGCGPAGLWGLSLAASAHFASKPKPFYSDTLLSALPCSPVREDLQLPPLQPNVLPMKEEVPPQVQQLNVINHPSFLKYILVKTGIVHPNRDFDGDHPCLMARNYFNRNKLE